MNHCTNIFIYVAAAICTPYLGSQQKIFVLLVQSLHMLIVGEEIKAYVRAVN